jgi:hypothetical protein
MVGTTVLMSQMYETIWGGMAFIVIRNNVEIIYFLWANSINYLLLPFTSHVWNKQRANSH